MKEKLKSLRHLDGGQTAVEYILLALVLVTLIISVTKKVREFLLADAGNCRQNSTSLICRLESAMKFGGTGGQSFRFFTLRR